MRKILFVLWLDLAGAVGKALKQCGGDFDFH